MIVNQQEMIKCTESKNNASKLKGFTLASSHNLKKTMGYLKHFQVQPYMRHTDMMLSWNRNNSTIYVFAKQNYIFAGQALLSNHPLILMEKKIYSWHKAKFVLSPNENTYLKKCKYSYHYYPYLNGEILLVHPTKI